MFTVSFVNLATGTCGEDADSMIFDSLHSARAHVETLRAKRRAARRDNGTYPPIIHGIRRNSPAVHAQ